MADLAVILAANTGLTLVLFDQKSLQWNGYLKCSLMLKFWNCASSGKLFAWMQILINCRMQCLHIKYVKKVKSQSNISVSWYVQLNMLSGYGSVSFKIDKATFCTISLVWYMIDYVIPHFTSDISLLIFSKSYSDFNNYLEYLADILIFSCLFHLMRVKLNQ